MPEIPAAEFWSAAKSAGFFGTAIMSLMWWRAELRADKERATSDLRHAAVMEALNAIKTFMEVMRDRAARSPS